MNLESMNTDSVKTDTKKFSTFGCEVGNRFLFGPKSSVFSLFIFQRSGADPSKNVFFLLFIFKMETSAKFENELF